MKQLYLYAIIPGGQEFQFGSIGLAGSSVHTIAHGNLACVVSDYPGQHFTALSKEELVRSLLIHQAVLEDVMSRHALLPVKYGTLLNSTNEVRELLSQGHSRLADALAQTKDKIQVEVAATWDVSQVLIEIACEPQIVQAREAIQALSELEIRQRRVELGRKVKEALDRRRDQYCQRMMGFLAPLALDTRSNPLVSDEMVMNMAFLVDRAKEEEFDRQIRQLNALFGDQINFRIIGPLPLYSFCVVDIRRPSWEEIDKARQSLSLSDVISESAVRRSFRSLAAQCHPDMNRGDKEVELHFANLRDASNVLLAYCHALSDIDDGETAHAITKDAVERTFLITLNQAAGEEVESFRFGALGGPS